MSDTDRMTAREVAAHLRCEYRKALRLIGDKIPGHFDGYRWTASRRDVEAYLQANTVTQRASKRRGRGRRVA